MRILVVAATRAEVAPLLARMRALGDRGPRLSAHTHGPHEIDLLVTGVGMVATSAWLSSVLARRGYELALNLGVCGSFDAALVPGTVVHVTADRLSELGAEDGDAFLSVQELGLLQEDEFPFRAGALVNETPPANAALARLPQVDGITVNTVHGNDHSIACLLERCHPQVESMEGAAFMYACLIHGIPFAQVRAVSNPVERRNRAAWQLDEAMVRLGDTAVDLLDHT